jgi:RNA polymerase sigma factor (sigma-70 family)
MYRRWDNISPEARLGYAYVVIRNLVIHFHRSLQMRREASLDELALDVAANVDADIGDLTVRAPAIEQALGQLPERQRRALYLRYWQGLPTAEIAKVLKIPAGTVRSDLTRASAQLRAALRPGF